MAITYTYEIKSLIRETNDTITDAVTTIIYVKTGTNENGITGEFHGNVDFTMDQVDTEGFITFNDLTESQVVEWIGANEQSEFIDDVIALEIVEKSQTSTKVEVGFDELPWYVAPEPSEPVEP
jgi:bacillopeptidase F (M6 metalloprotease family)